VLVLSEGRLVSQGAASQALTDSVMADVFRVSAYRAEYRHEAVIVPWEKNTDQNSDKNPEPST
jgi:iron complex transport system ATP-binding protein